MDNSCYHRPTDAEFSRKGPEAFAGLSAFATAFGIRETSTADLVGLLPRQLRIDSSLLIDVLRDRLSVGRIDAGVNAAEMVELEILGDWPDEALIEVSVGRNKPLSNRIPHHSVTLTGERSLPNPAWRGVAAILNRVALFQRLRWTSSRIVAANEATRLALDVTLSCVGVRRDRRRFSATTFAETSSHIPIFASRLAPISGDQMFLTP